MASRRSTTSDMPPVVIDASAGIAIVRSEADGESAATAIEQWTRERRSLVVPSHFWLEVVNALMRRHRWTGEAVLNAVHQLDRMAMATIEPDRPLLLAAMDLAERSGLSSYDAMYLAVAESMDGSLLTFVHELRSAAGPRAISLGGHRLSEPSSPYKREVTWPRYKGASAYLAKLRADALRDASTP